MKLISILMLFGISIGALLLSLFQQVKDSDYRTETSGYVKAIDALNSQLNDLKDKNVELEGKVARLGKDYFSLWLNVNEIYPGTKEVDTKSSNYQIIPTRHGPMLVSIKNIETYPGGHKVIFSIGNMTSATFSGFTLKVDWFPKMENGEDVNVWMSKRRSSSFKISNVIAAGSWATFRASSV